ncbi:MAG: hypothetical protein U0T73_14015, partial [Chitinophagales bacterium]
GPLWRLWPNPTGNYWNYEFTEPASWKLTDSRGEILETGFDRMGILHMENRPPGIYFFTSPYGSVKAVRW